MNRGFDLNSIAEMETEMRSDTLKSSEWVISYHNRNQGWQLEFDKYEHAKLRAMSLVMEGMTNVRMFKRDVHEYMHEEVTMDTILLLLKKDV